MKVTIVTISQGGDLTTKPPTLEQTVRVRLEEADLTGEIILTREFGVLHTHESHEELLRDVQRRIRELGDHLSKADVHVQLR